jgi:hypothetical protein
MQILDVVHIINAPKLYYLNLLGRLILRPLLVDLGGEAGVASGSTTLSPTLDARPRGCLIARVFGDLFDTDLII